MSDDVRAELEILGERRHRAVEEQREASTELRAVVVRAAREDVPVTEIARLARLSRQAVWQILRADERD